MAKGTFLGLREPDPDEPWRIHIRLALPDGEPSDMTFGGMAPQTDDDPDEVVAGELVEPTPLEHPESKRVEPWPPPEWFEGPTHDEMGKLPTAEDFARMTPYELMTYSPPWEVMEARIRKMSRDPDKGLEFWRNHYKEMGLPHGPKKQAEVNERTASMKQDAQLSFDDAEHPRTREPELEAE